VLTAGGESSQQTERSDTVSAGMTNSYQMEAQLRLVVEVVLASSVMLPLYTRQVAISYM